jgi:hypothetical protein
MGIGKVEAPRISIQWTHKDGEVVSLTQQPPLPPEDTSGTLFCMWLSRPQGYTESKHT